MRILYKQLRRSELRRSIIAFICIFIIVSIVQVTPLRQRLDNSALDATQRIVRKIAPRPAVENVVIVGIDEETERRFPEPFALWHKHLGDALAIIAHANPAVIGIDIVLPRQSYDQLVPGL